MFGPHSAMHAIARLGVAAALLVSGCGGASRLPADEAFSRGLVPRELREEYDVFAARCSKCHSLARPLERGIARSDSWRPLVERMRRVPGSAVSPSDARAIVRFLDWYSAGAGQKTLPEATTSTRSL